MICIDEKKSIENAESNAADVAFNEQEKMFKRVNKTREACVDSDLFRTLSHFTSKQVYSVGKDGARIDMKLVLTRLKDAYAPKDEDDLIDFESLGLDVSTFFTSIRPTNFMLGPLDVKPKERVKPQRQQTKEVHKVEAPVQITHKAAQKKEKTEHEQFQFMMAELLQQECKNNDGNAVNMFKFLINPESFTQTVENIFEYSFLVKDGWAGIKLDSNRIPVVRPENPVEDKETSQDKQAVIAFTINDWEDLKHGYGIQNTVLPHRKDKEYTTSAVHEDSDYEVNDSDQDDESFAKSTGKKRKAKTNKKKIPTKTSRTENSS